MGWAGARYHARNWHSWSGLRVERARVASRRFLAPSPERTSKPEPPSGSFSGGSANASPQRGSQALPQDSYEAELELLRRAHAAYASQEFTGALLVLAEHAHRFPSGRLAEEREALRVRSLAEVGRKDEARRAAVNFAARFPRSVLLSQIQKIAGTGEY
jgi:hypothetical protein